MVPKMWENPPPYWLGNSITFGVNVPELDRDSRFAVLGLVRVPRKAKAYQQLSSKFKEQHTTWRAEHWSDLFRCAIPTSAPPSDLFTW